MPTNFMSQTVCTKCPLLDCNEEDLHCILRALTTPNKAQAIARFELLPPKPSRKIYQHERYKANREAMLKAANERNARLRAEAPA
jgi:hypothetical protein